MLHPIFSTVVSRPDLVVDHLSAYAALAGEEAAATGRDLKVRVLALAVAGVFGLMFVLLAGVAAMLGLLQGQFHWALVGVPGIALLITLAALLASRRPAPGERFAELRRQLAADIGLLRTAGDSGHGQH
jgi:hypothetical protein